MSVYLCPECGYRYDEEDGDAEEGYTAGTRLADLPTDFVCPDCAVCARHEFVRVDD